VTDLELDRTRDIAAILRDAIALWQSRWRVFLLIAIAVIVPVEVAIFGVGLGEISDRFDADTSRQMLLLEAGVSWLLTTPLLTTMTMRALVDQQTGAREAITRGLELFLPALLVTVIVTAAGVVGLFLLIVPGVIVLIRLAFVVEIVAVEDLRGADAVRRSWLLSDGNFWRILGITIGVYLLTGAAEQLVLFPFAEIARAVDSQALVLLGTIIGDVIALPIATIALALLFFDLRARQAS
jgi:hypothetical protein